MAQWVMTKWGNALAAKPPVLTRIPVTYPAPTPTPTHTHSGIKESSVPTAKTKALNTCDYHFADKFAEGKCGIKP